LLKVRLQNAGGLIDSGPPKYILFGAAIAAIGIVHHLLVAPLALLYRLGKLQVLYALSLLSVGLFVMTGLLLLLVIMRLLSGPWADSLILATLFVALGLFFCLYISKQIFWRTEQ